MPVQTFLKVFVRSLSALHFSWYEDNNRPAASDSLRNTFHALHSPILIPRGVCMFLLLKSPDTSVWAEERTDATSPSPFAAEILVDGFHLLVLQPPPLSICSLPRRPTTFLGLSSSSPVPLLFVSLLFAQSRLTSFPWLTAVETSC